MSHGEHPAGRGCCESCLLVVACVARSVHSAIALELSAPPASSCCATASVIDRCVGSNAQRRMGHRQGAATRERHARPLFPTRGTQRARTTRQRSDRTQQRSTEKQARAGAAAMSRTNKSLGVQSPPEIAQRWVDTHRRDESALPTKRWQGRDFKRQFPKNLIHGRGAKAIDSSRHAGEQ